MATATLALAETRTDGIAAHMERDIARDEHRYLKTPLVQLISSGRLPKAALKDYAIMRWSFQAHAEPKMMLSHAAFLRGDDVQHLLENTYDEIMRPEDEGEHPGLWVRFAKNLGATEAELDEAARFPVAEVIGFSRTLTHYCRRSAAEGLATWYADEAQLPESHGATALALRKFYGLDDATIEYFLEHVRADIEHSDASGGLLDSYVRTDAEIAQARRAGAVTLWAWREMHEGILRILRQKYDF
ncbi:MAG: iron-containing redox enzyme family protein [Rhodospirillaceae bacterium]